MRLSDLSLLVDHVGDAPRVLVLGRAGGAVGQADLAVGIAEEGEVEAELLGEMLVLGRGVETDAEDAGVLLRVLAVEVPEPGTFFRSAGGVGLRIEPEHDLLAAQVAQANAVAVVVGDVEIGSLFTGIQHVGLSSKYELQDAA
jgi:hypothetical protein